MILPDMLLSGGGDPSQDAFASGLLAGAGLREISQVLGLSKRRGQKPGMGGPMPSAATMLQGNMGDIDKILLLSRMQGMMGPGAGPMPGPLGGPAPMPGAAGPMGPMGPLAGPVPLPPALPPAPLPGAPVGAMPPVGPMGPGAGVPGGGLPLQLLQQMLSGAGGIV